MHPKSEEAEKLGMSINVSTCTVSELQKILGDEHNIEKLIKPLTERKGEPFPREIMRSQINELALIARNSSYHEDEPAYREVSVVPKLTGKAPDFLHFADEHKTVMHLGSHIRYEKEVAVDLYQEQSPSTPLAYISGLWNSVSNRWRGLS